MKHLTMVMMVAFFTLFGNQVWAGDEKASAKNVYDLVIKAHSVVSNLGEEGLAAFNDPKGEFVYKDTYAFVLQCPKYVVAHPYAIDKLKGKDLSAVYPHQNTLCEAAKNPKGQWVEYQWPKPGEKKPSRKVGFVIPVEGTPYAVVASIFSDDLSVEKLNAELWK
ncbi:MAG: cache domain-containing protein [Deltaproteobacteria bacterium]|nr:cache domain-containing protein [Deltaproteobacteria bacterium]